MVSKIFFLAALIFALIWMFVFAFFTNSIAVHILAIMAILLLATSYITRNAEY